MSGSLILTPVDGAAGDWFGRSVSLSADGLTAIVGGPFDDVGGNDNQGSARVFDWTGTGWIQRGGALTPTDGSMGDSSGMSVSLSTDGLTAIVGSPNDDVGANADQGSARVFVWNGIAWVQRGGALTPTDGATGDYFGWSVSLSGNGLTAILGGFYDNVGVNADQGSARVFDWNGSAWVQRGGALTPTDGNTGDYFGYSVLLSANGRTAIVGGYGNDTFYTDAGSARVFDWNGTAWVQRGGPLMRNSNDISTGDWFGYSVSLTADGNTAIVGAVRDDIAGKQDQGSAHVFDWNGIAWVRRGTALTPSDGATFDNFGGSVSLSADGLTALVGGRYDDVGGDFGAEGSARVFDWNGSAWVQRGVALSPTDAAPGDNFGNSVSLSADGLTAIVGGQGDNVGAGASQGSARVFAWHGTAWVEGYPASATLPATISIAADSASKSERNEGSTPFTFTVTRTVDTSVAHTANWAVTGSGTDAATAADFFGGVLPSGTVSFDVGETSKTITVNVLGDTSVEPDEGFTVTLSNPSSGLVLGTSTATRTIFNDDASVSIASTSATKAEGQSGNTLFTFTVTRTGDTYAAHTLNWAVSGSGSNAATTTDFVGAALPSGTVTFAVGDTQKFITINVQGDTSGETDEGFTVTLSSPSTGLVLGTASATGAIINDDTSVSIAATSASKAEGQSGTTSYTFTATRTGDTSVAHTANWAVTGSGTNAASAADFVGAALPTGTVNFAIGETSKVITIDVVGDASVETDEGFTVTLSSPSTGLVLGIASATGTIINDDASIAIAATSASKAEGQSGTTPFTFTATRSGDTSVAHTANWAVTGSGTNAAAAADFVGGVLPSGTVSFAIGETSKTITVNVLGETSVEANEGFTVTLGNPSTGLVLGTSTATGTIINDDASVSIAAASASKAEGQSGSTPFTFTATRTGDTSTTHTANWSVTGSGTNAANATDFQGGVLPSDTVTFGIGETSKTITVNVLGDTSVENDEGFTVTLSAPSTGLVIGTATASGTIINDDASVSIVAASASKAEGNSGTTAYTFTATRTGDTTTAHTASWAVTSPGTNGATAADFQGGALPTGTVSFGVGETSKTITVQVAGDTQVEADDDFLVTLSNPSAGLVLGTSTATGTIINDDASVSIAATSASKAEGNSGGTAYTFTATRTGDTSVAHTANWAVSGSGTNVAAAADFVGGVLPTGTVSFGIGETSKTITVSVLGETSVETDEGFTVTLGNPSTVLVLGTSTATGTIINDDASVSIAAASASKAEGNSGTTAYTFTATRTGDTSTTHTANWTVAGSGSNAAIASDFVGAALPTGTVSFGVGETSKTITVQVAGDTQVEADDDFLVTLSNPSAGLVLGTSTATGTIVNDDASVSIAAASASKAEGNSGGTAYTFTATRTGDTTTEHTANWAVSGSGSNAATAADFVGATLPTGTVSFAIGETSKTITVNVAGDQISDNTSVENNEDFTVTLSTPSSGLVIGTASATGTIINDDAVVFIGATSASKAEGQSGSTPFTFTAIRTGDTSVAHTANWAVTGSGTNAATAADFVGAVLPSGTLSFGIGETSKTITVNVLGETSPENFEVFTVMLSTPSSGLVTGTRGSPGTIIFVTGTAAASGTIINDDGGTIIKDDESAAGQRIAIMPNGIEDTVLNLDVAGMADGGFVLTWEIQDRATSGGAILSLAGYTQRFDAAGVAAGAAQLLFDVKSTSFGIGIAGNPAVSAGVDGSTILAWTPLVGGTSIMSSNQILVQRFDADGSAGQRIAIMPSGIEDTVLNLDVAGMPDGGFVLTWEIQDRATSGGAILSLAGYTQRFDAAGVAAGAAQLLFDVKSTSFGIGIAGNPAVSAGGDGSTILAWTPLVGGTSIMSSNQILIEKQYTSASVSIVATSASKPEGNSGSTPFTFTATRTGDTSTAQTANWAVTGSGTNAANATDFQGGVLPSDTVSFGIGVTSQTITVNVLGDTSVETDEGFTVTLSNPSTGLLIGTATASGTIQNDDSSTPASPSVSGVVYHWKSHALLSGVTVSAENSSSGSSSTALEFRDVRTDASGNVLVDLWGNGASGVGNFGADLSLGTGITAAFQSSLPGDWTVLQNSGAGSLSLAGFGLTSVSGSTKLGTLTFAKSSSATPFSVSLQSGEYGTLTATSLSLGYVSDVTGADGVFQIDVGAGTYTLDASRSVSDVGRAVSSADALAALKLAVSLNPNSDPDGMGPLQPARVSPYQFLAADVNNSGTITSADALSILKMAVRLVDAPQAEWLFLREQDTFWNAGSSSYSVTRSAVPNAELPVSMSINGAVTQNLVGVLTGDVNGSWRPLDANGNALAEGAYPVLPDSYFVALSSTLGAPLDLWGS